MELTYKNIVQEMLNTIPQLQSYYDNEVQESWQEEGYLPPHIAFRNFLNPFVENLLLKQKIGEEDERLLVRVFTLLKNMASSKEIEVQEVVCVTVMARIGDSPNLLRNALKYMGNGTIRVSRETEEFYGRAINITILDSK